MVKLTIPNVWVSRDMGVSQGQGLLGAQSQMTGGFAQQQQFREASTRDYVTGSPGARMDAVRARYEEAGYAKLMDRKLAERQRLRLFADAMPMDSILAPTPPPWFPEKVTMQRVTRHTINYDEPLHEELRRWKKQWLTKL